MGTRGQTSEPHQLESKIINNVLEKETSFVEQTLYEINLGRK